MLKGILDKMKKTIIIIQIYFTFTCLNINLFAQVKEIYDLKDHFEKVDGLSIPKLSKNKMFIEENNNYEKYFDVNKKIKINTSTDFFNKTLSFYNNYRPTEVQEEYTISINDLLKYDYEFKIKYTVRIKYFTNGKIRSYEVYLRDIGLQLNLLEVGTWYYFDETGKIIKKVDHEKKYRTSLKDIFKIYKNLTEENFFLKEIDDLHFYKVGQIINRFTNDIDESYWVINLPEYSYVIDGNKAKIIETINKIEREELKQKNEFLKRYVKNPKTEKKTGYFVIDDFEMVDGLPLPRLSENKMFFKNDKKYKNFYETLQSNYPEQREIKINREEEPINKTLIFKSDRLIEINEKFYLKIIIPTKFNKGMNIGYNVIIKYFPNGNIKSYQVYCVSLGSISVNMNVGTWYKFDEEGKLLKEVNFNKIYNTTFNDILKYYDKILEQKLWLSKFGSAYGIGSVSRFSNSYGNSYWIISYEGNYSEIIDDKKLNVIEKLDGVDRNEILYNKYEKKSIEYSLNKEFNE